MNLFDTMIRGQLLKDAARQEQDAIEAAARGDLEKALLLRIRASVSREDASYFERRTS